MPARFRLFDSGPDKSSDRYFLVDARPYSPEGPWGPWRAALSFNRVPYHPSCGIGLHVELDARDWNNACIHYFRNWGKRIKLDDMGEDASDAAHCAIGFVLECLDKKSVAHKHLAEFLTRTGRAADIVDQARQDPKVARILKTLLRPPEALTLDQVQAGDRVTRRDLYDQEHTGRAVEPSAHGGWILHMDGKDGAPFLGELSGTQGALPTVKVVDKHNFVRAERPTPPTIPPRKKP